MYCILTNLLNLITRKNSLKLNQSTLCLPFLGMNFSLLMSSTAGTRNARVLPDPVLAWATTSLPSNNGGMALAWISVILVKPISSIAFRVFSHTLPSNTEKDASFISSRATSEPGTKTIASLIITK